MIDKGIPTTGLLAQVLVAKYADHLPLYRQETIFGRAGLAIPRSTLAQWVGTCGVRLQPLVDALKAEVLDAPRAACRRDAGADAQARGNEQRTGPTSGPLPRPGAFEDIKAVVYDFCESRAGEHARGFLGDWKGALICDDFAGDKALITSGVTEVGCLAHARRHHLHAANKSQIAGFEPQQFAQVYDIEREVKEPIAPISSAKPSGSSNRSPSLMPCSSGSRLNTDSLATDIALVQPQA